MVTSARDDSAIRRRWRAAIAALGPYAAAASAALILWHAAHDRPLPESGAPAPLIYADARAVRPAAGDASSRQATVAATIQVVVGRNDTLDAIFRRMALDPSDLAAIRNLPGIRQSIDFLKPGEAIKVTHAAGAVRELTRKVSETETLQVVRGDAGFAARVISHPVETRVRTASAVVSNSLFQAAQTAHVSDTVALALANVFAWDIDFALDIRAGDHFTVEYEQVFQDGRYLHDGAVLAAEFVNDGRVYRAVRYTDAQGRSGYYTPDGRAMRKAFLRAPVDFTRVSSGFNPHRRHPILDVVRGHMGTDYAAPVGTAVYAAGDGRVAFAGRKGGYGNAVLLEHGGGITTLYGHLSRFARALGPGTRVQQGEVIGYVGMTGLATGPHLHYEYRVNGTYQNPESVHLPGAAPLRAGELQRFQQAAQPLLAELAHPTPDAATGVARAAATATPLADRVPTPGPAPTAATTGGAAAPVGG